MYTGHDAKEFNMNQPLIFTTIQQEALLSPSFGGKLRCKELKKSLHTHVGSLDSGFTTKWSELRPPIFKIT